MNELGIIMIGLAAKGAAFAGFGLALGRLLRRRGPAASATVALATLVGMVGVAALSTSPWPRFWTLEPRGDARAPGRAERATGTEGREVGLEDRGTTGADLVGEATALWSAEASDPRARDEAARAPREPGRAAVEARRPGWRWPAWVAAAGALGVAVGLGRFALGLVAVAMLRKGGRPLDDAGMLDMARRLREELGIDGPVELRVVPGLATPATVGWLRPAILLPEDWTDWDDRERRAVLSHEMAHILRNDYVSGLWAQLCLAIQYYHPLAHRLARRLRLEQELAADAWGARLSGGNGPYLSALARLALRNEPRPVGWPARSFRPARGTLMRRIEMLRDSINVQPAPLPQRARAVALGALIVAGLALAGLRGPGSPRSAEASPIGLYPADDKVSENLGRGFIPADATAVVAVRVADLLAHPEIKGLIDSLNADNRLQGGVPFPLEEIEQATFVWLFEAARPDGPRGPLVPSPTGVVLRSTKAEDWKSLVTKILGGEVQEVKIGEWAYLKSTRVGPAWVASWPDDRTLVMAEESALVRMLRAETGAADRTPWAGAFKAVKKGQVAMAVDVTWLLARMGQADAGQPGSPLGAFAPLLDKVNSYAVGLDAAENLALDGLAVCRTDDGAGQVADTLKAAITLGRNAIDEMTARGAPTPAGAPTVLPMLADLSTLLAKATVASEGKSVRVASKSQLRVADTMKLLAPSVDAARDAARRAQSVNNIKQIMLAMHNYASSNNAFPAASSVDAGGKPLLSWRVAILPYIEQVELYQQFHQNEAWDSPHNKGLIARMPLIYKSTKARPADPYATFYQVFTGNGALFSDKAKGATIAGITDGTSNTIAVVEAGTAVPWTKPDDIAFDPKADLPKLGGPGFLGGFNAGFADGSVRFIKFTINPMVLKALITRAGGEVVSSSSY